MKRNKGWGTSSEEAGKNQRDYREQVLVFFDAVPREGSKDDYELPGCVMRDVQEFLEATYSFDLNPLSHLRRYFPLFMWEYHLLGGDEEARETKLQHIVQKSDYLWGIFGFSNCVVSSVRKETKDPRKICWDGEDSSDGFSRTWGTGIEIKKVDGKVFVLDSNQDNWVRQII